MQKPLVSVLIPCKNTASFLPDCLQSILDQQYQKWEVIAIDDHSTDNSFNILKAYAQQDSRIRVYPNTGEGIIEALRTAYALAKGEMISRMDSDDIMFPNRIEHMVRALQKHGTGHLSVGQVQYFSKEGIHNGYARYEKWLNSLTTLGQNFTEIYKECVIPSPCWMLFRTDLDKVGGFDSNRYPEDYDLAFRFYEHKLTCIPTDEVLHRWRDYSTRTSRTSEVYAQNYFLDIKLFYFLKLDRQADRPLLLWGAGNKGKTIAQQLLKAKVSFHWVCDNPHKIGKEIYGIKMQAYDMLDALKKPQCIIGVANTEAQGFIVDYLMQHKIEPMDGYFFFC